MLHSVTITTFELTNTEIMDEQQRKALIIEIRMQLATHRQFLRDASARMTEAEKNGVLDKMLRLQRVLA